ncbi:hypothetical protein BHE74_00037780 [Ensete ventricosum]|nr:hypothetical protein BHE74_00037780 [Ensete ventricosum]
MGRHYARKRRLCERYRCRRPSSRCLPIQEIAPTSDLGRGRSPRTSSLATSDHPLGGLAIRKSYIPVFQIRMEKMKEVKRPPL